MLALISASLLHNRRMVPFMLEVGGTQGWQSKWSRQAISIYSSPPLPQPHSGWSVSCLCLASTLLYAAPSYGIVFKIQEISHSPLSSFWSLLITLWSSKVLFLTNKVTHTLVLTASPESLYPTLLLSFVLTFWPLCCSSAYDALSLRYLHGWLPYFMAAYSVLSVFGDPAAAPTPLSSIGYIHICTYQHIPDGKNLFFLIYIYRIFKAFVHSDEKNIIGGNLEQFVLFSLRQTAGPIRHDSGYLMAISLLVWESPAVSRRDHTLMLGSNRI